MENQTSGNISVAPNTTTDWDWKKAFEEKWNSDKSVGMQPLHVCPHCGYCPHCGRGGYHAQPYQPYPYPGWPHTPWIVYCGTTTTGTLS